MTSSRAVVTAVAAESRMVPLASRARFLRMTERNVVGYRRAWPVFLSGIFEPVFYLLSIGIGVGSLVGDVPYAGRTVPYETFVASGMLATAAMNGAVFDTTFTFFIRLKYGKLYDAILATPLEPRDVAVGEVVSALAKGAFYSACFLLTMLGFGMIESWWGLLALPATVLIGAAFASIGLAGGARMRSWLDFDFVNLAITPMFLFSATFFPLDRYPDGIAAVVRWTPLYQGVVLCRGLTTGEVDAGLFVPVAYLLAMVVAGVWSAARRVDVLLRS